MSVLQTNAFPVGYSAVTGNRGTKLWRCECIAGQEGRGARGDLSIVKEGKFFVAGQDREPP